MTNKMAGCVLTLLLTLFSANPAAAQTYTQMQWGVNKSVSPYTFGANINGTWSNLGTVSSTGAWTISPRQYYNVVTNPTANMWGISFNNYNQTVPNYHNGFAQTVIVNGSATNATNGALFNSIVESSYNRDIMSNPTATPVYVNLNAELQVKNQTGGDWWANLGVLDIQNATGNNGGSGIAGIVRGNWVGTGTMASVLSVSENYSGRNGHGVLVTSSQSDGVGAPFDNSPEVGVKIHQSHGVGLQIGGLLGGASGILPATPIGIFNGTQTAALWQISNNGNTSATETVTGNIVVRSAAAPAFPAFTFTANNAGTNLKVWSNFVANDGTYYVRLLNDAQNAANDWLTVTRTGYTPLLATINSPLTVTGATTLSSTLNLTGVATLNSAPRIKGSSSGYTTISTNNSSATDYTATLPANSGTIAETNLAQTFLATQSFSSGIISSGAAPSVTGAGGTCAAGTVTAGALAGTVALTGNCVAGNTLSLASMPTATTGYVCDATDRTAKAVTLVQTSASTTGVTFEFAASSNSGNVIQFKCMGY